VSIPTGSPVHQHAPGPKVSFANTWVLLSLTIPATLGIALLREMGLVADTPTAVMAAILFSNFATNVTINLWIAFRPASLLAPRVHLAVAPLSTGLLTYANGWGSVLAIGFTVGAAEVIRLNGSKAFKPVLFWTLLTIALGEFAVAMQAAPSMIPRGFSFAVALVGSICLVLVLNVIARSARHAEAAEVELRRRSDHFETLVAHATDAIISVAHDGTILSASPALSRILGRDPHELEGSSSGDLAHPDDVPLLVDLAAEARRFPNRPAEAEARLLRMDGTDRRVRMTITAPPDPTGPYVVNLHDITTQHHLEEQLRHQAAHDPLTGVWNRSAFVEHLTACAIGAGRSGETYAVVFIDLDGFKAVNDTAGHATGDVVLIDAAARLRRCLRRNEVLARLGGDEFAILIQDLDQVEDAFDIAGRLVAALAGPWPELATGISLTASVGVAVHKGAGGDPEELLHRADQAMYSAKQAGGTQWALAG